MDKFWIFLSCLISRILFKALSGYDNFELFGDAKRYDLLSDGILRGEGNMDIVAYLAAPLYPYLLAGLKTLSPLHWQWLAVAFQFLLVSYSAVCIYQLGKNIFDNRWGAIISSVIYITYPLTLWYNFTLSQETCFQAFLIIFCHHFISFQKKKELKSLLLATTFFSLSILTKSHITLLLPFLFLYFLYVRQIKAALTFIAIILIFSLPHGLKNLKQHDVYTLSSHGNATFFLLGYSDYTYDCILHERGTPGRFAAQGCVPHFIFDRTFEFEKHGLVNQLSVKKRNKKRFQMALEWINENPRKVLELKSYGLKRFILPGLDYQIFNFKYWLMSFIAGLLLYLPGYYGLYQALKSPTWTHLLMVSLILICAAIFILLIPVNRFRIITMEPLLCVYAGQTYYSVLTQVFKNFRAPD